MTYNDWGKSLFSPQRTRYAINTVTVGLLTRYEDENPITDEGRAGEMFVCAELMGRGWFAALAARALNDSTSLHAEPVLPSSLLNCPSPEYR